MSRLSFALAVTLGSLFIADLPADDNPLAPWRTRVQVTLAVPEADGHTIHSYFNTCPESPDGRRLLYFASTAANGETGDVCVRDRSGGAMQVLARGLSVEDAHRVACQQWVSQGRRVVFHHERDGQWLVTCVDVADGRSRDLATGRLAGWGQPHLDVVPLYGLHWDPEASRDLELLNVETGEVRTVLQARDVDADWVEMHYAGRPKSIFFPVLSPDGTRLFFKLAAPAGGIARSSKASDRRGLFCYNLAGGKFLYNTPRWGHPAWHPDSRTIAETGYTLFDSDTGRSRRLPDLPAPRVDHPSFSPDGRLIVTDSTLDRFGGAADEWGVIVADARGGEYVVIHRFDNSQGAKSWRRSHPHPVFSPDGRRIYFNVSSDRWTRLHVATIEPAG